MRGLRKTWKGCFDCDLAAHLVLTLDRLSWNCNRGMVSFHIVGCGTSKSRISKRLTAWNAVPVQQFSHFATADMRESVQPVKAGDCILHLEIVQPACGQNEFPVPKPPSQFDAFRVDIAESQTKSQASGSQAFARTGLALRHDTTCGVTPVRR